MDCICISHQGANTDGANLVPRAESRLLLTRIEPGQDTLSGDLQQQGVGAGPQSSLSARVAPRSVAQVVIAGDTALFVKK